MCAAYQGGRWTSSGARVIKRLQEWEQRGAVEFVGRDECYLRIVGRL